jgi:murein DD-endopeptidase MepM/ murein hydrolase activator NlpD
MKIGRAVAALVLVGALSGTIWWSGHSRDEATYMVKSGDTLWKIAKSQGITLGQLREWNGLSGDLIEVGQVLRIGSGASMPSPKTTPTTARKKAPAPASKWKPLKKPSAETCLDMTGDPDEGDMVASAGLSMREVQGSLNAIIGEALRCEADAGSSQADLVFEILVGCDGLVDKVTLNDRGDASKRYAKCVGEVLGYADFPPHDMPDGMRFTYPVTVEF